MLTLPRALRRQTGGLSQEPRLGWGPTLHSGGSQQDWEPGGVGGWPQVGASACSPKTGEPSLNHFPRKARQLESRRRGAASPPRLGGLGQRLAGTAPLGAEAAEAGTEEPGGLPSVGLQGAGLRQGSTRVLRRRHPQGPAGRREGSSSAFSRGKGLRRTDCLLAGEPKHQVDAPVSRAGLPAPLGWAPAARAL